MATVPDVCTSLRLAIDKPNVCTSLFALPHGGLCLRRSARRAAGDGRPAWRPRGRWCDWGVAPGGAGWATGWARAVGGKGRLIFLYSFRLLIPRSPNMFAKRQTIIVPFSLYVVYDRLRSPRMTDRDTHTSRQNGKGVWV